MRIVSSVLLNACLVLLRLSLERVAKACAETRDAVGSESSESRRAHSYYGSIVSNLLLSLLVVELLLLIQARLLNSQHWSLLGQHDLLPVIFLVEANLGSLLELVRVVELLLLQLRVF